MKGDGNHVDSPANISDVNGTAHQFNHTCMAHDCGDNQMEVMFAPGGRKAWAVVVQAGQPNRFFGAPNGEQRAALMREVNN